MIVSHDYEFIFLKTNKTAGTSLEIGLSRFCGARDIITPITPDDEALRSALEYRGPQNFLPSAGDGLAEQVRNPERPNTHGFRFYNHMPAREAKAELGTKVWARYYKFCFERNPWDRVISLYYFRHPDEPRPTISEFIQSDAPLVLKRRGIEVYTIDGQIAVDRICQYENLASELEVLRQRIGIPEAIVLPKAKAGFRQDKRHYRDILGEDDQAIIARFFADEIALFGYQF